MERGKTTVCQDLLKYVMAQAMMSHLFKHFMVLAMIDILLISVNAISIYLQQYGNFNLHNYIAKLQQKYFNKWKHIILFCYSIFHPRQKGCMNAFKCSKCEKNAPITMAGQFTTVSHTFTCTLNYAFQIEKPMLYHALSQPVELLERGHSSSV